MWSILFLNKSNNLCPLSLHLIHSSDNQQMYSRIDRFKWKLAVISTRRHYYYWKESSVQFVSVGFVVRRLKFWWIEISDSHDPDSLHNNFVTFIFWINCHKMFTALMRGSFGLGILCFEYVSICKQQSANIKHSGPLN